MLRKRLKDPKTLIFIGTLCLALAGTTMTFLRRTAVVPENLADGAAGFLYGIAIGTLLLGIWRRGRQRSAAPHDSCS